MKNWLLAAFVTLGFITTTGCNDTKTENKTETRADEKNVMKDTDVPESVKTAFAAKYPGATEVIWEEAKENDNPTIKVKFKRDDKFWKAEFNSDGTFLKENEDN